MRKSKKNKLVNFVKIGLALTSVFGTMIFSNISVAKAEDLIHTHIWATKYDKDKHWEYCTVCAKTQNSKTHTYVDHWREDKESCWHYNYSTRVCQCGYSYIYNKPHNIQCNWTNDEARLLHYKACKDCGTWSASERCKNDKGLITCKNPGTCLTCGATTTSDNHYIVADGKCRDCGVQLVDMSTPKVNYNSDYSKATVTFTIRPKVSAVTLTGSMCGYTPEKNYKTRTWKSSKNNDGSFTYTLEHEFNSAIQRKCTYYCVDSHHIASYNNTPIYIDQKSIIFTVWQDHKAPTVTEIKQVDQAKHNDWATIKELTICGTEDLSDIVTISIKDKQTGDVIVDKATADVKNGKYSYKCTPPLEGPAEGRKYIVTVVDQLEQKVDKEFTIYKTDCRGPILRSGKEYTTWSKTKNLELELTDYGSGSPQSSLNNQTSHKVTKVVNGKYYACYTFADDMYDVSEYKIYFKDGLGNASVDTIKVGRVDNTKPTIINIKAEVKEMEDMINLPASTATKAPVSSSKYASITVTANDINKKLNKEGSGVVGYALTQSKDIPEEFKWQKINIVEAYKSGTYYLWVKDGAGNIANLKVITVKDDMTIEVSDKEIEVEVPEDDKVKVPSKEEEHIKKDDSKRDKTPKTGDSNLIYIALGLLVISFLVMIVVRVKKNVK